MIIKEPLYKGKVRVTFSMPAGIWADTIYLVGEFNGWDRTATPLKLGEHCWSVSLELDAGQSYQYRYLVNGSDWYNDWRADRYEPNEFGGDNSVVETLVEQEYPHDTVQPQPDFVYGSALQPELSYEGVHTLARSYGGRTSVVAAMKNTT
jgi:hypothetical protein